MIKVDLIANFKLGTIQVNQTAAGEKFGTMERYTFSEVTIAESSNYVIPEEVLNSNGVEDCFFHAFKVSFDNRSFHVFACASPFDKQQWLRVFYLLLQMKSLKISPKVNLFTFEHFR